MYFRGVSSCLELLNVDSLYQLIWSQESDWVSSASRCVLVLSEFGFDLVNRSVLEIVFSRVRTALGSGGRVNLGRKTEGGIVIVEAAVIEGTRWVLSSVLDR